MQLMKAEIHPLEEIKIKIINAPALISHPIDQTADRVHSQTVEVIFREPVIGGGLHKAGDFSSGEQEIAAPPFAVGNIRCRILIEI